LSKWPSNQRECNATSDQFSEKSEKRLLIFRFTRAASSWFELANTIETGAKKDADNARKTLKSSFNRCHEGIFKRYILFRNRLSSL
jgi:hypothetical protein